MKILITLLRSFVVVIGCLILSGCPVQFKVDVRNDTDEIIYILSGYSDVVLSEIESGDADKVAYNFDCFRVKSGGQVYEYKPVIPPEGYVKNGLFSSSLKAVFTSAKEFRVYTDDKEQEEALYLVKGCK
ncbi:hypothetical protein QT397_16455 [Microbulbifer sp. MKSA007]|nr:hypothetical protein QT397_16455 [Microbulbifer sp. MKSA007]